MPSLESQLTCTASVKPATGTEAAAELVGVASTAGNVGVAQVCENNLALLALCGAPDIPVSTGSAVPLSIPLRTAEDTHGPRGLGYAELPEPRTDSETGGVLTEYDAAEAWIQAAREYPGELVGLVTGPLTNFALALRLEPSLPRLLRRLVIMGGAFDYRGNTTPVSEWNISVDPEAAAEVFAVWGAAWGLEDPGHLPIILGLNLTENIAMTPSLLSRLATAAGGPSSPMSVLDHRGTRSTSSSPVIRVLEDAMRFYFEFHFDQGEGYLAHLHDPLAAAVALDPDIVRYQQATIDVELLGTLTRGMTVADWRGHWGRQPNAHIGVEVDPVAASIAAAIPSRTVITTLSSLIPVLPLVRPAPVGSRLGKWSAIATRALRAIHACRTEAPNVRIPASLVMSDQPTSPALVPQLASPLGLARGPAMANRVVLAPLTNKQSHADGTLSKVEHDWLVRRAQGGFALTMTCATYVSPAGKAWHGQIGLCSDAQIPGLANLARGIREAGSISAVQLHHGGRRASESGQELVSAWDDPETGARAMTTAEVEQVVEDFAIAALRADRAGFDGVELHGAHGYLIGQFLDAEHNHRQDGYGGSLANRSRLLFAIIDQVRARCRPDFQIGLRLSPERYGIPLDEALATAERAMTEGQIDYLDMSLWDCFKQPDELGRGPARLIDLFARLPRGNCRLGVAGKISDAASAQACLDAGADFAVVGRGAILHHDFARRAIADPGFAMMERPVSRAHLRAEGLGEAFIDYLAGWGDFVKD